MSTDAPFFSGRLRQAAQIKGLKQQELADLLGVKLDRVKSIYSGKVKKLDPGEVLALEEKLHLRPDWLLRNEGPMFKTEAEQAVFEGLRRSVSTVADLQIPEWVKRLAQEWSFALERGDAGRIVELAQMNQPVKTGGPDPSLLRDVIWMVLQELDRRRVAYPPADKLSDLIRLAYQASERDRHVSQETVQGLVNLLA